MNDAVLKRQARQMGYPRQIPGQLSPAYRMALQIFIQTMGQNARSILSLHMPPGTRFANAYSGEYVFNVNATQQINGNTFQGLQQDLQSMFQRMIDYVRSVEMLANWDRIQVVIRTGIGDMMYISTPLFQVQHAHVDEILELIESMLQSGVVIYLNRAIFVVRWTRRAAGGVYLLTQKTNEAWIRQKRGIVFITAPRGDCFFQCLAVHFGPPHLRKASSQYARENHARVWRTELSPDVEEGEMISLDQLQFYELALEHAIYVLHSRTLKMIYKSQEPFTNRIYLLYQETEHGGHYHYIIEDKLGSLFKKRRWCHVCENAYQDDRHRCIPKCFACGSSECMGRGHTDFRKICQHCNRNFYNQDCYDRHHVHCTKRTRCPGCNEIYNAAIDVHQCLSFKCGNCRRWIPKTEHHQCYIQTLFPKKEVEICELAFYDYECYFDNAIQHKVFCVVLSIRDEIKIFYAQEDFMNYVLGLKEITLVAHNGARYDVHFIKQSLIERQINTVDIVHANTYMSIEIPDRKIRFIDSLRFIPISLRKFPKTFHFDDIAKGYFPYRFFTHERLNYVGVMPDIEWYEFEKLEKREQEEAKQWYESNRTNRFDIRKICVDYCIQDVQVLKKGCLIYRELVMQLIDRQFDPFTLLTIAGVCMQTFRMSHMQPHTIGLFKSDYHTNPKFEAWKEPAEEVFEKDGRQVMLKEGQIHYFSTCIEDGCSLCYSDYRKNPHNFLLMYQLRKRMETWARDNGIHHVQRECEWKTSFHTKGISIRDAFFGGRTEVIKLYCNQGPMRYLDFTSLYPTILYDSRMPIGHPVYIEYPTLDIGCFFGFARVRIRPPKDLYLPLLPRRREDGKLIFDLCEGEGTWTIVELLKARELGYEILVVYAVLHFNRTSSTLFQSYITTFFRVKLESDSWSKLGCTTADEKTEFLHQLKVRYDMDDVNITDEANPGMRYIAKLFLNSLWGKFGQRDDFSNKIDTYDEEAFFKVFCDDRYDMTGFFCHNDKARTLCFRTKKDFRPLSNTNVAIAAFTTAYARLRLYSVLEKLGERVCYMDTDSVIFIDDGEVDIPMGYFLGDMSNQLDDAGDYIEEFCSTGPKSYAYRTHLGKSVCKVKGIHLTPDVPIHFEALKNMVLHDPKGKIMVQPMQFIIGPDHNIHTKAWGEEQGKTFSLTHDKRSIVIKEGCIDTIPFQ